MNAPTAALTSLTEPQKFIARLRQSLAAAGLASTAFDFVGQGRSGGELAEALGVEQADEAEAPAEATAAEPAPLGIENRLG